ncbi:hypothetical protein ACU4HD_43430 [Cupriavidus basilensis]
MTQASMAMLIRECSGIVSPVPDG